MIGRLNHVAIGVRDIAKASAVYRETLGAEVSEKVPQPDHGVADPPDLVAVRVEHGDAGQPGDVDAGRGGHA